ncbi:hypothetical protein DENSPDRAFT_835095 [Dentipellis sp. KUC8613]|nr:hypothetical protein DENSPDRAFT_835095 [Dentipellis sp. KUC8613]
MLRPRSLLSGFLALPFLSQLSLAAIPRCLSSEKSKDASTLLASKTSLPTIFTSEADWPAVHIAASTFASDIASVLGGSAKVQVYNISSLSDIAKHSSKGLPLIVGTLNKTSLLDELANNGTLKTSGVAGQWEAWRVQSVEKPTAGVSKALVLFGADKRGTIYSMYTLSEQAGVSPWVWFADVPTKQHDELYFADQTDCFHGSPSIKYRALFINDEQPALTNWANKRYHAGVGVNPLGQSFLPEFYAHVFELLLRMRANYIWPAMWADSFPVAGLNEYPNGGLGNGTGTAGPNLVLADRMGIVYGTTHQEPMARNTPEWWAIGKGDWDYTTNNDIITSYWRYGAERAAPYETLYTMGMRGNGDTGLTGASKELLEKIVANQRQILSDANNGAAPETLPQLWCMYKEVQEYYAQGLQVPDDVTILFADDNFGNLRTVLGEDVRNRTGGGGIYYHFEFFGAPRSYKWLGTNNLVKSTEQLLAAYRGGLDRIWVFNVADIKPLEVPLNMGLDMAYDIEGWNFSSVTPWVQNWASKTFGSEHSEDIAHVIQTYLKMNSRIKPEAVDQNTWSLTSYDEADRVLSEWQELTDLVDKIEGNLPQEYQAAFYELAGWPTLASANHNRAYVASSKSLLYSIQARSSADYYASLTQQYFEYDQELANRYNNLLGGKWNGIANQTHFGYMGWPDPRRNFMPPVQRVVPSALSNMAAQLLTPMYSEMRLSIQGSKGNWPGDTHFNCDVGWFCGQPYMSIINRYEAAPRYVEIAPGGPGEFHWKVTSNVSWLSLEPSSGHFTGNASQLMRPQIKIDWDQVKAGNSSGNITQVALLYFEDNIGAYVNLTIPLDPRTVPTDQNLTGHFVESQGFVSINAVNASRITNQGDNATWATLPNYGLHDTALTTWPPTMASFDAGKGPVLEFDFYWFGPMANATSGLDSNFPLVNVTVSMAPTLNYHDGKPIKYALQLDGGDATVVQPVPDADTEGDLPPDWGDIILAGTRRTTSNLTFTGDVTGKHTLKLWGMEPGLVVENVVIGDPDWTALGPPQSYRL